MDLLTRFLAARRDKLLMRLGCWLVCFSLVLGLMLPQQRAEALVTELSMTAVASVAAAYLGACGLTFITQGMDKDALVSSVQRLIQEFLDTELGGVTIQDWLGGVWSVAVMAGKLIMGRSLTDELMGFAQWVAGRYGTQAGENPVYCFDSDYIILADGSKFFFSICDDNEQLLSVGSTISNINSPVIFPSGRGLYVGLSESENRYVWGFVGLDGLFHPSQYCDENTRLCIALYLDNYKIFRSKGGQPWYCMSSHSLDYFGDNIVSINESFSIDRAPSMSYIPEGIAAEQGIALDVGAESAMDLDLVLQGVLEDVLTGTLDSTMEAAGEIDVPIDPPAGEITDVDNLGLPALGQALTSRFPFSIPWDFFRAVKLLAAPAKAPYFEVDFMEPLADNVGGWKGSTAIVLDFEQYAIIGQLSRWTSTIGFCLMLAGATKRLIWTA